MAGTLRHAGVIRTLQLIRAIHGRPRTIEALADRFGVTQRTIYRDLLMLELIGVEVKRRVHDGYSTYVIHVGDCPCCEKGVTDGWKEFWQSRGVGERRGALGAGMDGSAG